MKTKMFLRTSMKNKILICVCFSIASVCLLIPSIVADTYSSESNCEEKDVSNALFYDSSCSSGNVSSVIVQNGVPKISINGKIIDNIFGVYVYCTGFSPYMDRYLVDMKKIIDRTKALGIPILSFDILWSDYDNSISIPKNAKDAAERFHTANLDAILNYAAEKEIYVVLQLLVHAHWGLPKWWKNYKNNKNEMQLIDSFSEPTGAYNRFQSPVASFQSCTHRELLKALIKRLVGLYCNHPAVVGWAINVGPTGENGYAPNYINLRFDRSLPRVDFRLAMADYSAGSVTRFTKWLREKYYNIDILNQAWESKYPSFKDIQPPNPIKLSKYDNFQKNGDQRVSMKDWQLFRHEAIIDEWRFLSGFVRRLDSSKIVMGKTSWIPVGTPPGTQNMMASALSISRQQIIDLDKVDVGITKFDYMPNFLLWSSRIDYAHFAKFSRKNNVVRVFNFENWIGSGPAKIPGDKITLKRSISVLNVVRNEGAYMWFTVSPDSFHGMPNWSWNEVRELVKQSFSNELESVKIKENSIMFYYDIKNLLNHYFEEDGDLTACKISYHIARSFFDTEGQPEYGFINKDKVEAGLLDAGNVRLLIMINQRTLSNEIIKALNKYVSAGGTLLLVGSNGIFDNLSRKNSSAIRSIVPELSNKQINHLYDWGLQTKVQIPIIVVYDNISKYEKININGNPGDNYQILRSVLSERVPLAKQGKLILTRKKDTGRMDRKGKKDFIRAFDINNDGKVSKWEFQGPREIFEHLDRNHDGTVTRNEFRDKSL